MKKILFFLLILFLGFLLRSGMFLHGDFIYLSDQARDLLLTKSFIVDHHLTLIGGRTGFGGLFHGAAWIYVISPFFFLFKGNPFWTLVPLFEIINLGIIVLGFYVGSKLYGRGSGLLFAFFLSISKPLIQATPVTTNAEVLPIVVLLYLFSIVKFLRDEDKFFALSLFFIGLGFQFESAFAVLLVPLTIVAILVRKKVPSIKSLLLGVLGFATGVSSFVLFDLRHQFIMTKAGLSLFTNTQKPLPGYEQYAHIGFRITDRAINLWNSLFSTLYDANLLSKFFLVLIIGLAILIFVKRYFKKETLQIGKEFRFSIIAPVLIFGIYILYPLPLWPHYLLPVVAFWAFALVLSIKTLWEKPVLKPLIVLFLLLVSIPPLISVRDQYLSPRKYIPIGDSSYINQLAVANYVTKDSDNKAAGYFVYTPGILTYSMDYLIWWLGASNRLTSSKSNETYLILYPTLSGDKGAYSFWERNVINTKEKYITQTQFQGGITVEKFDLSKDPQPVDPNYFQNLIFR